MKPRALPPLSVVRATYDYDPDTGVLRHSAQLGGGPVHTWIDSGKRLRVKVGDDNLSVVRLIWFFVHGTEPRRVVQLDQDTRNTRLVNLAGMTSSEYAKFIYKLRGKGGKQQHASAKRVSSSGHKGISWHKLSNAWKVLGDKVAGRQQYVGQYRDLEIALSARRAWERGETPPAPAVGGNAFQGSANGTSKLTEDAVRRIRTALSKGTHTGRQLADEYGVSPTVISQVRLRRTWKHV